jgi:predicted ATPase
VRVDVLGGVAARGDGVVVSDPDLGGRRARLVLVALALAAAPVSPDRLAAAIWGDDLPATWQVAIRGVVRGLRTALARVPDGDAAIVTTPDGYRLAPDVEVDVVVAARTLQHAADVSARGRPAAAIEALEPLTGLVGAQLLPGEDGEWLEPHRRSVDATARRALELTAAAAEALGDHPRAIDAARRLVGTSPLDERGHRALISALDRAGDRAGAVLAYEQCRAVLADQLGIDPSAETVEVYLAALRDQAVSSSARLPSITSTFVGRAEELAELTERMARPGLITVAGRGGVGKSRLVLRAARSGPALPGGRLWVSLAPVAQDALVAATVALDVGVAIGADDAAAALGEHLAPLGRVLLVLDGCEVVVDGVASLAADLMSACPQLTLVITSRVELSVDGEQLITVEPLQPPADEQTAVLMANPQVRLLLDRVRDGGGELVVDDRLAPYLVTLVRRCGGLPLALELVAAQLAAMPVGDLLDHLAGVVVEGDDRLRSVARSSYALLDDDEAAVFRRFAVLDGAVGLPLVRRVVSGGPIEDVRVVRVLRELTARGLLSVDREGPRWRYQQDDDLHRYARELLVERGEEATAFQRLADAVAAVLPADARTSPAPFQDEVTDLRGSMRSLFGAALDGRADASRCLELAFRLHRYFAATNVAEGRFWLARLLSVGPPGEWTPYATYALGYLSYWSGDTMEAVRHLEAVVTQLEGVEDSYAARALIYLAGLLDDLDRGGEAVEYVRRAIGAAAPFEVDLQVAAAMGMGSVLAERGDSSAAAYARDAIELCRRSGSVEQLALAMPTAAMVCWQVGALAECRAYVEEARPLHTDTRRIARVVLLSSAAGLALADGDVDAAVDFGRQADLEATELGVEREVPLIRAVLARSFLARADVGSAADRVLAALDAAAAMAFEYPLAISLETAALVADAAGVGAAEELASVLDAAALVRARGDRPAVPSLAGAVVELRARLGAGPALDVRAAATLARGLVGRLVSPA